MAKTYQVDSSQLVREFHEKFNAPLDADLASDSADDIELLLLASLLDGVEKLAETFRRRSPTSVRLQRAKLMIEELREVIEAMGHTDIVSFADGLADLRYVTDGSAVAFGLPIRELFQEVHDSNMSKTPGEFKPLKGPGFVMPRIAKVLMEHGVLK